MLRQGFGAAAPEEATPATAPRVADPAPFLSNVNSVFSPDTPADARSGSGMRPPSPLAARLPDNVTIFRAAMHATHRHTHVLHGLGQWPRFSSQ
jgi:hypothetical protein